MSWGDHEDERDKKCLEPHINAKPNFIGIQNAFEVFSSSPKA